MLIVLVLAISIFALVVAWGLRGYVLRQDNGTPEMRRISDAIQEGAEAFLRRQYKTISVLSIALGALGPGDWSLDHAFGFSFPFQNGTALLLSALVGLGGTAVFLAAFWRPPRDAT